MQEYFFTAIKQNIIKVVYSQTTEKCKWAECMAGVLLYSSSIAKDGYFNGLNCSYLSFGKEQDLGKQMNNKCRSIQMYCLLPFLSIHLLGNAYSIVKWIVYKDSYSQGF